ncbi:MAG: Wzz/FepE/Etk N-terminal domain-containing protein, partial [Planctomycetota bacterium]
MSESSAVDVDHFRPLSVGEVWGVLWGHKASISAITVVLTPLFVLGVFLIPAQFDSYAQILVRLGRSTVAMDPTASLTPTVSLQDSRASQVSSVREMLQSRAMAIAVVREIGSERILEAHSPMSKALAAISNALLPSTVKPQGELSAAEVATQIDEEMAILRVHKMLDLHAPKDAYTINLEARSEDPFLSRDVLRTLLTAYQKHHALAHSSQGSFEFFEDQAERARQRAVIAKEELRQAKTTRGIISVGSSQDALRSLITQVDADLMGTSNELATRQAEIAEMETQIARSPSVIQTEVIRGIAKATGDAMRNSLYDLEVQYNELAVKLTYNNPKLRAMREQLNAATDIASTEEGERPQTREAIN